MEEREIDDEERRKGAASRKREECEAKEAQLSKKAADAEEKLKEARSHTERVEAEAKLQTERVEAKLQEVMTIGFQKARKADELHYAVQTAKKKHEEVQEAANKEKRRVELLLETLKSREKAMSDLKQQYEDVSTRVSEQDAAVVEKWKLEYENLDKRCRIYETRLDLTEWELEQKHEIEQQMVDASTRVLSFQLNAIVENQVKEVASRIARVSANDMVMKDMRKIIVDEIQRLNSNDRSSFAIFPGSFYNDFNIWWTTRNKLAHNPKYDEEMDHVEYQEVSNRILDDLRALDGCRYI